LRKDLVKLKIILEPQFYLLSVCYKYQTNLAIAANTVNYLCYR